MNDPDLCFPIRKASKIAVLDARFRRTQHFRLFAADELDLLHAWQPDGLVSPLDVALMLADQKLRNLWSLPSLSTAIVVLTCTADSPLAGHHRDLLWRAFGVPIFEHLAAQNGTILARECEVHDGLHICLDAPFDFEAEIDCDPCPCGLETPRLVSRLPVGQKAA